MLLQYRRQHEQTQMPKMMLGTAASSSTATPTGRLSQAGAIWVRKIAIPKLSGTAITIAITEVTSVPYTGARAPNLSVTGFQTSSSGTRA